MLIILLAQHHGSTTTPPSPRTTIDFDFAWRYSRAVEPRFEQCTFEQNVNYGRHYIWSGNVASKEECCSECANRETCRAWDFNGKTCWVKDNSDTTKIAPGRWAGRLAGRGNSTEPAQAQPSFDDSQWAVVDAPHDMGRSHESTCLAGGRRLMHDAVPVHNNCRQPYGSSHGRS